MHPVTKRPLSKEEHTVVQLIYQLKLILPQLRNGYDYANRRWQRNLLDDTAKLSLKDQLQQLETMLIEATMVDLFLDRYWGRMDRILERFVGVEYLVVYSESVGKLPKADLDKYNELCKNRNKVSRSQQPSSVHQLFT
jgi:hypothetical protein